MITKAKPKPKPLSTGRKGDLDSRRWVVVTLRNNGAAEAQFPLPVTVNCERIVFDRDTPVIAPAYYLDTISETILPKFVENGANADAGEKVRNEDQATFIGMKYQADIEEIPDEYQSIHKIEDFALMLNSEECPEEFEHVKNANFGQSSFGQLSYDFTRDMEAKLKPKPRAQKASAGSNS